ncbi:MAG TPA: hypothetical protein VMV04_15180 [Thermodesulfobacteriota bacterium]|nr:hypothetical protein [Thermodesulfobacteriota bacterium]
MKRTLVALAICLCCLGTAQSSRGEVEWTLKKQLDIEATPLDIVLSTDGQWIFVLTSGEVLIYSSQDNKIVNRVPVDASFDKLSFSPVDNTLLVASRSGKAVRLIQLERVYKFSTAGLPFKGREDARVTIAVFSDYQ